MSEFKLSCPHCKQHVLAKTDWATQAIDCPHCHKAFTVPNMPGATPPPAASTPQTPSSASAAPAPKRGSRMLIILIVLALVTAGVTTFFLRGDGNNDGNTGSPGARPVSGTINGSKFNGTGASVNSFMGTLEISQGDESVPEQGVKVFLFPKADESLAGRSWNITPSSNASQPHVHLTWKKDGQAASAIVSSDYEMHLTTGNATNGVITGTFKFKSGGETPASLEGGFTAKVK